MRYHIIDISLRSRIHSISLDRISHCRKSILYVELLAIAEELRKDNAFYPEIAVHSFNFIKFDSWIILLSKCVFYPI